MFLCRQITNKSFPQIALHFNGRDHTTVMHACRKVSWLIENKAEFSAKILSVRASVVPTLRIPSPAETESIRLAHEAAVDEAARLAFMGLA
jgi:hypothetical protein